MCPCKFESVFITQLCAVYYPTKYTDNLISANIYSQKEEQHLSAYIIASKHIIHNILAPVKVVIYTKYMMFFPITFATCFWLICPRLSQQIIKLPS